MVAGGGRSFGRLVGMVADALLFLGEFKTALQVYEQLLDLNRMPLGFWDKRSVN